MNRLLHDIERLALVVLLPLLMAMAPAMAQTVVYQGDITPLSVVQVTGDTYQWELYSDGTVNFATTAGNCPVTSATFVGGIAGPSVQVQWLQTGTYFFKVNAYDPKHCTNNIKIGMIVVEATLPTATITSPDPICKGETGSLFVALTGTGPWNITYSDGVNSWTVTSIATTPFVLSASPKITTNYWITQVTDKNETNNVPSPSVTLQVNPKPISSKIYLYQP